MITGASSMYKRGSPLHTAHTPRSGAPETPDPFPPFPSKRLRSRTGTKSGTSTRRHRVLTPSVGPTSRLRTITAAIRVVPIARISERVGCVTIRRGSTRGALTIRSGRGPRLLKVSATRRLSGSRPQAKTTPSLDTSSLGLQVRPTQRSPQSRRSTMTVRAATPNIGPKIWRSWHRPSHLASSSTLRCTPSMPSKLQASNS